MFIQVIEGKLKDPDLLRRQVERWMEDLKPGADGYLGSTSGVTEDGRSVAVVRFESEEAARANSERPEQSAWWSETEPAFDGEVTFRDCREVDTVLGGGSNDAGFVQIIEGRAKDKEGLRSRLSDLEGALKEARPDVLGAVVAWHGDGAFTQVVYFSSEEEARGREKATEDHETRQAFLAMLDGPPVFRDLRQLQLD